MTRHIISAPVVIFDADDNELARAELSVMVEFTAGYRADDTDPGCGDTVEFLGTDNIGGLRDAARAYLDLHQDEVCARCRADLAPDPDRLREDAFERGEV